MVRYQISMDSYMLYTVRNMRYPKSAKQMPYSGLLLSEFRSINMPYSGLLLYPPITVPYSSLLLCRMQVYYCAVFRSISTQLFHSTYKCGRSLRVGQQYYIFRYTRELIHSFLFKTKYDFTLRSFTEDMQES